MSFFTNAKDKTPLLNNSFVVYKFTCPGCNINYIGKTERTLNERTIEHAWSDKNSAINSINSIFLDTPVDNEMHIFRLCNLACLLLIGVIIGMFSC